MSTSVLLRTSNTISFQPLSPQTKESKFLSCTIKWKRKSLWALEMWPEGQSLLNWFILHSLSWDFKIKLKMCKIFFPFNKIVSVGQEGVYCSSWKLASRFRCFVSIKYTLDIKDGRKNNVDYLINKYRLHIKVIIFRDVGLNKMYY